MSDNVAVHATHCCIRHWCKYGDDDCPVMNGTVDGISFEACEMCGMELETAQNLPSDVLIAVLVQREALRETPVTSSFDMKGELQRITRRRYVTPWVVLLDTTLPPV